MAAKRATEDTVRDQAQVQSLQLVKVGNKYRLEAANGTVVADDCAAGNGLTLGQIAGVPGSL